MCNIPITRGAGALTKTARARARRMRELIKFRRDRENYPRVFLRHTSAVFGGLSLVYAWEQSSRSPGPRMKRRLVVKYEFSDRDFLLAAAEMSILWRRERQ